MQCIVVMQCFRVVCHEISHESLVFSEYTVTRAVVNQEKALLNYFIQLDIKNTVYTINTVHDGKVRWNTDEYTTASLYSDWLYFYGIGLKIDIRSRPISLPGRLLCKQPGVLKVS